MSAETLGVWLIGIGSLVIFLRLVVGSQRPAEGLTFRGPLSTGEDRLRFAVEGTGAAFVALGSVMLAIADPPSASLLLAIPFGYVILHGLSAWKLRQYWLYRRDEAVRAASADSATDFQRMQAASASVCASWRWCLLHPFNRDYWPKMAHGLTE